MLIVGNVKNYNRVSELRTWTPKNMTVREIYGKQIFLSSPVIGTVNFGPCKSMTTNIVMWRHAGNTPKHPPCRAQDKGIVGMRRGQVQMQVMISIKGSYCWERRGKGMSRVALWHVWVKECIALHCGIYYSTQGYLLYCAHFGNLSSPFMQKINLH